MIASCGSGTSDECKYLKAAKQKKSSLISNENIKKLNADIRNQCSESAFTVDEDCKNRLFNTFGQQHNCQ